jgi:hypothetical protein
VWVIYKTVSASNAAQNWTLGSTVIVGVVLMIIVRLVMRPSFFQTPRESYSPEA